MAKPSLEPMVPPPLARLHVWQIQAVRDVLLVVAVFGLIWAGYAMRSVTVPLLVALLLAYLFEPLVSSLTRRLRVSRPVVVGGLILSVGAGVLVLLALVVPLIIGQTMRFVQDIRAGRFQTTILKMKDVVPADHRADFERAVRWLMPGAEVGEPGSAGGRVGEEGKRGMGEEGSDLQTAGQSNAPVGAGAVEDARLRAIVREELAAHDFGQAGGESGISQGAGSIWDLVRSSGRTMFGLIGGIVELGLLAFLIPFYFFFFSVSFPAVAAFGQEMIPVANRGRAMELIGRMDRAVAGFVRGRIVICFLMGVMLAIGWMFCGVPYSIVLGLVVGGFSLVPYLGTVGLPLAVGLLAFNQMQMPEAERMGWVAIIVWPTVVFSIVQIVEAYVLTPLIAGKATNLDPVTILVAVLAGGSVGGVYGMILAIPVAACLKILFTDVLLPKIRAWTRGEVKDPLPIGQG